MNTFEPHRAMIVVITAALLCAGLIVLLRPILQRYALARPNARSSHVVPTPQGAGIAVITATLSVAVVCAIAMNIAIPAVLFGATLFMAVVGLADDVKPIQVLPRLLLQAAAVGIVLFAAPVNLRIVPAFPIGVERALLLFAGLWFVNLVNFMDGLDLMTVAELVPITGTLIVLGWLDELPALPDSDCRSALRGNPWLRTLQSSGCKGLPRRRRQPADRLIAWLVPVAAGLASAVGGSAAAAALLSCRRHTDAAAPNDAA